MLYEQEEAKKSMKARVEAVQKKILQEMVRTTVCLSTCIINKCNKRSKCNF